MSLLSIFRNFWELFKHENAVFNGEQEKESICRVRVESKNLSLGITVCYQSASLMMTNGDPWDRYFYTHPHTHDIFLYCKQYYHMTMRLGVK